MKRCRDAGAARLTFGVPQLMDGIETTTLAVALFGPAIAADQLWFRKVQNHLEVSIIGTSDKLTVSDWYLDDRYRVEQFKTADNQTLLSSQVDSLVQAMAAFSPPPSGQTALTPAQQSALSPVIAANWN